MQLSIILVTTNAKAYIADCLRAISTHTSGVQYEVIVSDNASTDGTVEIIARDFPWVKVVQNERNLGFGTANNRGAQIATGEYLCFFNDDTVLVENSLPIILRYMHDHPDVGCMGFHLTFPDGTHQDSVRAYPRLADQSLTLLKLHHVFPRARALRRYVCADFDYTCEQEVDQVMGACMVIPRQVFEHVGGFDEHFFVWFEEVDLQKRIHELSGLRIVYAPITQMIHVKGATFGRALSVHNQRQFNRSIRYYFKKHHSFAAYVVIAACSVLGMLEAVAVQMVESAGISVRAKKNKQF